MTADTCEIYVIPTKERHYYGKTFIFERNVYWMMDKEGDIYKQYEKPTITNRIFKEPEL